MKSAKLLLQRFNRSKGTFNFTSVQQTLVDAIAKDDIIFQASSVGTMQKLIEAKPIFIQSVNEFLNTPLHEAMLNHFFLVTCYNSKSYCNKRDINRQFKSSFGRMDCKAQIAL